MVAGSEITPPLPHIILLSLLQPAAKPAVSAPRSASNRISGSSAATLIDPKSARRSARVYPISASGSERSSASIIVPYRASTKPTTRSVSAVFTALSLAAGEAAVAPHVRQFSVTHEPRRQRSAPGRTTEQAQPRRWRPAGAKPPADESSQPRHAMCRGCECRAQY
jgi:hypothetical protein